MLRARTRSSINLAGRAHTIAAVAQTAHTNNLCVRTLIYFFTRQVPRLMTRSTVVR